MQEDNFFEMVMEFPSQPMPAKFFLKMLYSDAAYFGYCISKIANTFTYNVPIDTFQPIFKFRALVPDIHALAQVIFTTVYEYFIESEPEESNRYLDTMEKFLEDVSEGLIETRVRGLLEVVYNCQEE